MPWYKVDDGLHSHPKARQAGLEAMGLWVLAGTLSMDYKLGGRVPAWFINTFKGGEKLAKCLVSASLWEPNNDPAYPFRFHDWSHYQPTEQEIEHNREFSRRRQQKRREALARARQEAMDDADIF